MDSYTNVGNTVDVFDLAIGDIPEASAPPGPPQMSQHMSHSDVMGSLDQMFEMALSEISGHSLPPTPADQTAGLAAGAGSAVATPKQPEKQDTFSLENAIHRHAVSRRYATDT